MRALGRATLTTVVGLAMTLTSCASQARGAPPDAERVASDAEGLAVTRVLAVSVDGLNPDAIRELGRSGAPTLHRLIRQGASTMNARTSREQTITLPNHTGMVTGRRIDRSRGGHGVTWNDDRMEPTTVQEAAGHDVSSAFEVVDSEIRDTALFASKTKFSLFNRSWPIGVDTYRYREDNAELVRLVRRDLVEHPRAFTFLHLSAPDVAGHAYGFMSPRYLDAVRATDRRLGRILATLDDHPEIKNSLDLILTADHGGPRGSHHHDNPTLRANYRVPFVVWGPGVSEGANLYALNPDYANPGRERTRYSDARQPVRNGMVANLVTDLLGLGPVPGSEFDADQDLDIR